MYGLVANDAGIPLYSREQQYNLILDEIVARFGSHGGHIVPVFTWLIEKSKYIPDDERKNLEVGKIEVTPSTVEEIQILLDTGRSLVAQFMYCEGLNNGSQVTADESQSELYFNQWLHFYESSSDILVGEIDPTLVDYRFPPGKPGGHAVVLFDIVFDERDIADRGGKRREPNDARFRFKNSWVCALYIDATFNLLISSTHFQQKYLSHIYIIYIGQRKPTRHF